MHTLTDLSLRPAAVLAGLAGILMAAAVALWLWFGGAVFQDLVAAGFALCF